MLVVALAFALVWCYLAGFRIYVVRTGSMSPGYRPGDAVITRDPGRLEIGDVITVERTSGRDTLVTHRIVAIEGNAITTKGDANDSADAVPARRADVVGKVVAGVPRLGYLLIFLRQPSGAAAAVIMIAAVVLLWQLFFGSPAPPAGARRRTNAPSAVLVNAPRWSDVADSLDQVVAQLVAQRGGASPPEADPPPPYPTSTTAIDLAWSDALLDDLDMLVTRLA